MDPRDVEMERDAEDTIRSYTERVRRTNGREMFYWTDWTLFFLALFSCCYYESILEFGLELGVLEVMVWDWIKRAWII